MGISTIAAHAVSFAGQLAHRDGMLAASDGATIAYRTFMPERGLPQAQVVMQMGTLGEPQLFDGMASQLAARGVASIAVGTRATTPTHVAQHAEDLDRVVQLAQAMHPTVPTAVGGTSLGAMIALDYAARAGENALPVAALSPVVVPKFLSPTDIAKVGASLVSKRAGRAMVDTPMSAGVQVTSNAASPEFAHRANLKVQAGLFGDVAKMAVNTTARGVKSPVLVAVAGDDQVAARSMSRAWGHMLRSPDATVQTLPNTAHDLSQETNHPIVADTLATWVRANAARPTG